MYTEFKGIKIKSVSVVLPEKGICSEYQTAADLGFDAAERIFENLDYNRADIGGILYVGSSPDYRSPCTACVLHGRLGLSQDCLAFDLNQSSAGFGLALQMAIPLAKSMTKGSFLVILGDSPSKWASQAMIDKFQLKDAGSALLISTTEAQAKIESWTSTWSSSQEALTINEGGFRVSSKVSGGVDFLSQSAANYGDLKFNEEVLNSNENAFFRSIMEDLKAWKESYGNQSKIFLTGFYPQNMLKELELEGVDGQFIPSNYLGSSIPRAIVKESQINKSSSLLMTGLELGEGMVSVLSTFEIDKEGVFPMMKSAKVFDNWEVDHQM